MLSIIVPSLRKECMESLEESIRNSTDNYELIVISPHEIFGENVVWIKEETPKGVYRAVERGLNVARGDFILHMPDDMRPMGNAINDMREFVGGRKVIGNFQPYSGMHRLNLGAYYKKLYSFCPFLSRETLDCLDGVLMDTYYTSFYGDPDLSLRAWQNGILVETEGKAGMSIQSQEDEIKIKSHSLYEQKDCERFKKRWEPILGKYTGYQIYQG